MSQECEGCGNASPSLKNLRVCLCPSPCTLPRLCCRLGIFGLSLIGGQAGGWGRYPPLVSTWFFPKTVAENSLIVRERAPCSSSPPPPTHLKQCLWMWPCFTNQPRFLTSSLSLGSVSLLSRAGQYSISTLYS